MSDIQVEQIDVAIEDMQKAVVRKDNLIKLQTCKEFLDVIDVGYFEEESAKLVLALAHPAYSGQEQQSRLNKLINGVGCLSQYFGAIMSVGTDAEKAIKEHEELRAEILSEEVV